MRGHFVGRSLVAVTLFLLALPSIRAGDDKVAPFDLAPLGIYALIDVPKNAKTEWRYDWLDIAATSKSTIKIYSGHIDLAKRKKEFQDDTLRKLKRIIEDTPDTLVVETDRAGGLFEVHVNVKCGTGDYYITQSEMVSGDRVEFLKSEEEAKLCVRAAKSMRQTEAQKKSAGEVAAALATLQKTDSKIDRKFGRYYIMLSRGDITDADLATAGKIPHIERLVLNHTGGITPNGLAGLAKANDLTKVSLQGSETTNQHLASIKTLTNVKQIQFLRTSVTGDGLANLAGLTQLEHLDLAGHEIDDASLVHLKGLKSLNSLDLGGSSVTDAGLDQLKAMTKLTDLRLNETKVTDTGLARVAAFKSLAVLDLGGTSVTDAGLEKLKVLTKLTDLWLRETKITDAGLAVLKNFPDLETLTLSDNAKITDAGLAHLTGFIKLRKVTLSKTGVTKAGVIDLKKTLPKVEIENE